MVVSNIEINYKCYALCFKDRLRVNIKVSLKNLVALWGFVEYCIKRFAMIDCSNIPHTWYMYIQSINSDYQHLDKAVEGFGKDLMLTAWKSIKYNRDDKALA